MKITFRADASESIGSGHLMRCLALAQECRSQGHSCLFITSDKTSVLNRRLRDEGFAVTELARIYPDTQDLEVTNDVLRENPDAWLVLDGYHFDTKYQAACKETGNPLLVVDDNAIWDHYNSDIVLNQNIHAGSLVYSSESYTRFLLGTRYMLLRNEYKKWQGWKRTIAPKAKKLLVSMGGADQNNTTATVIDALELIKRSDFEVRVVIGSNNVHSDKIHQKAAIAGKSIYVYQNVADMSEHMAWADLAVSAGGVTSYEMAYMALPNIMIVLADNQLSNAERLGSQGAAVNLGWYADISIDFLASQIAELMDDVDRRSEMSSKGRELVDGEGTSRVIMAITGARIRLRTVRPDDCRLVWEWANEPAVREMSFSSQAIPWEGHQRWFEKRQNNPQSMMWIGVDSEDKPLGLVRYDIEDNARAIVGVSVDINHRGAGIASALLKNSLTRLFNDTDVGMIDAFIKPNNIGSIKAFSNAGYSIIGKTVVESQEALCYRICK
ncbi:MAG: UDP-2,4-diacetamido-2,4,6-trideoxy-beta-L-altropyranose hydrolase [Acidobacteriota bacterium]